MMMITLKARPAGSVRPPKRSGCCSVGVSGLHRECGTDWGCHALAAGSGAAAAGTLHHHHQVFWGVQGCGGDTRGGSGGVSQGQAVQVGGEGRGNTPSESGSRLCPLLSVGQSCQLCIF